MSYEKLLPCPFCGCEAKMYFRAEVSRGMIECQCKNFFKETYFLKKDKAIKVWNTRTEPSDGELFAAQAYIVIGNIIANLELDIDKPEIQEALDYFSRGEYDDDFLPWDLGGEHIVDDNKMVKGER